MDTDLEMESLKFQKIQSSTDVTFWQEFGRRKINDFQLSEDAVPIFSTFTGGISHQNVSLAPKIFLNSNSFDVSTQQIPKYHFKIPGKLINTNKIETFKDMDKKQLLHNECMKIIKNIQNKEFIKNPSLLYSFFIISYADLKKHKYFYWLCFPAIVPKNFKISKHAICKFSNYSQKSNQALIIQNFYKFCGDNALDQSLLFCINKDFSFCTLSQYESSKLLMFGYIDNGNLSFAPSWFLRNILLSIAVSFNLFGTVIKIFCVRNLVENLKDSLIIDVSMKMDSDSNNNSIKTLLDGNNLRCVGWERNAKNQLQPKKIELAKYLDPVTLSSESVDLNLKLMRWRRLPDIDLELIKSQKCLLCGAGTLGTYISRVLLAWGCSNICFVDNGKVSYSNPVRQCLFKYTDCIDTDGTNSKAKIAAKAVKEIFPSSNAKGHNLCIPMPGHFVDAKSNKCDFERFEQLVIENDVIFLLTDSRESRWLPSLLAKVHNKIVINVALGFDGYLVMRHSHNNDGLACYFCSDVVAPIDSLKDRSLDQQCTVTRPGLAPIAAGLGIELFVDYLQREKTKKLCAEIPHQIRGHLYDFQNRCIQPIKNYNHCSACSEFVVKEYKEKGWDFVMRVMKEPKYLESVCGLDKLKDIDLDNVCIDWDDDDEECQL